MQADCHGSADLGRLHAERSPRDDRRPCSKRSDDWLPQFAGKSLRPTPAIVMPAGVKPVDVPLDPALAIANRFGKLATQDVNA